MKRVFAIALFMLCVIAPMAFAQDAIQLKAEALGATLGAPVGEVRTTTGDGLVREYENGTIYYSPANGAYLVNGTVLTKYEELGAESGKLGYPVGDLQTTATGASQLFEHGLITVSRTSADPQAEILEGVSIAEGSLTVTNPGILGIGEDGMLTIRQGDANFVSLNCTCIPDPDVNPPIQSERAGLCAVRFSRDNTRAICFNKGDCKGICRFTN